ncbi:MAG: hypothetical protein R3E97_03035 [Candidatus Eisenbacteria bacterium]
MSRPAFLIGLLAAVLLRLALGFLPGYGPDIVQMKSWALMSAREGVSSVFETTTYDYPPLFILLIRPIGEAYLSLHPEFETADVRRGDGDILAFRTKDDVIYRHGALRPGVRAAHPMLPLPGDRLFTFLIKLPGLLFDLVIAALLHSLVGNRSAGGTARRSVESGRVVALLWLLNPAVLWDTAYWGLPDSIHSAFAFVAVALAGTSRPAGSSRPAGTSRPAGSAPIVGSLPPAANEDGRIRIGRPVLPPTWRSSGRWFLAGAALAAGVLMKPLAAPLVPLLIWAAVRGARVRGLLALAFGAGLVVVALYSPFLASGNGVVAVQRLFADLDAMPYTSINAHNLWWWLGSWRNANDPFLLGMSARTVGLLAFLLLYAVLLATRTTVATPRRTADLALVAASVLGVFFLLSTHMHENHLFTVLPFLTLLSGRRTFLWLLVAASLGLLSNLVLHDPNLGMPTSADAALTPWESAASHVSTVWIAVTVGWLFVVSLRPIRDPDTETS